MLRVVPVLFAAAAATLRIVVMLLALSLGGLSSPTREAAAQDACAARCKGDSACLNKCAQSRKKRPQARQGNAGPKPSSSTASLPKLIVSAEVTISTRRTKAGAAAVAIRPGTAVCDETAAIWAMPVRRGPRNDDQATTFACRQRSIHVRQAIAAKRNHRRRGSDARHVEPAVCQVPRDRPS